MKTITKKHSIFFVYCILFSVYCLLSPSNSFSQTYQWAKNAGATNSAGSLAVTNDTNGNIYVAGFFYTPSITFGSTTLISTGSADMFLVKYDASGNVLWAKSAGGIASDFPRSITADANGNIFVTGDFGSPTIIFGFTTLTNTSNNYHADIFIVKYDASGNVLWAESAGGNDHDYALSVTADANGNSYVAGYFQSSSVTFGSTTLNNVDNTGNTYDMFLVKYDASGNVLWANGEGGNSGDWASSVSADASGNIYVAGGFNSPTIIFGSTTFFLNTAGGDDMFLVKYDANGNVLWATSEGGNNNDVASSVSALGGSGNSYVAGYFSSSTITFGSTTLNNAGVYDMFLVKYDASGNVLWAKSAGGSSGDEAFSISADASGNIYVAGYFQSSTITFGSAVLSNAVPSNTADMFLVKYDTNGNVLWATSAVGSSDDYAYSVSALGGSGNSYVAGLFYSSSITFGSTTLNNVGSTDMFVAKLSEITATEEVNSTNSVVVYPNPSNGNFTIAFSSPEKSNFAFEIQNVLGEIIYSEALSPLLVRGAGPKGLSEASSGLLRRGEVQIDLSKYGRGVYFLNISNEENSINTKIIKN